MPLWRSNCDARVCLKTCFLTTVGCSCGAIWLIGKHPPKPSIFFGNTIQNPVLFRNRLVILLLFKKLKTS